MCTVHREGGLQSPPRHQHVSAFDCRSISVARGEEISRLEKKELLLQGEKTKLMKKLAEKDRELKDKKEALTTTEIR